MTILVTVLAVVILLFGFVVAFGPPYVPTLTKQKIVALDLLDLQPGQTLLELGSGDGRVMRAAAARGLRVVGVELNPILVLVAYVMTWRYRKQVHILWGNMWQLTWPPADGVFTFLLPRLMPKLDRCLEAWHTKPLPLASFAFAIPGKKPTRTKDGVFLYRYR
jgi:Mycolic acid cyclopropane synthetase